MELRKVETKRVYDKKEQFYIGLEVRKEQYSIKGVNEAYWKDFEENSGKNASSLLQYKSAVKRFIDATDKDVLFINTEELENYLNNNFAEGKTKENQTRYIKSFLTYIIEKNMPKALKNTDAQLIMSLIPQEYRTLINVLLNK